MTERIGPDSPPPVPAPVAVVRVNGLRTPLARAGVVYVGRAFASWPESPWHNPYRPSSGGVSACLGRFREYMLAKPAEWWADLWAATDHGRLPLGCWCYEGPAASGVGVCHAAALACELNHRYPQPNGGAS